MLCCAGLGCAGLGLWVLIMGMIVLYVAISRDWVAVFRYGYGYRYDYSHGHEINGVCRRCPECDGCSVV